MNNEERDRRVMLALKQLGIELTVEAYCDEWYRQFGIEQADFEIAASTTPVTTPDRLQSAFADLKRHNSILMQRAEAQETEFCQKTEFGGLMPGWPVPKNPLRVTRVDPKRVAEMAMCLRPSMRREADKLAIRRELLIHGYSADDQDVDAIIDNQRQNDAIFAGNFGKKE